MRVSTFKWGIFFTSDERMDGRLCVVSALMQVLYRTVLVKRKLSRSAKLSIYQSVCVPALTCGPELWVVIERKRSWTQVRFFHRLAGLIRRDRARSSDIRRELFVEMLLLCLKRS